MIWRLLSKSQIKWEIVSNFGGFSDCPNFNFANQKNKIIKNASGLMTMIFQRAFPSITSEAPV